MFTDSWGRAFQFKKIQAVLFDDGTNDNGRVALDTAETVGNIALSASGTGSGRRSTLQVTAFPGLNGVNILCRESGGDSNVNQNVDITVLGKKIRFMFPFIFTL